MRPSIAAVRRLTARIVVVLAVILMWRRRLKRRIRPDPEVEVTVILQDGGQARIALSVHNPAKVALQITRLLILTPPDARLVPDAEGYLPFAVPPDSSREGAPAVFEVLVIVGNTYLVPGAILIGYEWEDRPDAQITLPVRIREGGGPPPPGP